MLPPEEELLTDQALSEASVEQLKNLRSRVDLALRERAGGGSTQALLGDRPEDPLPGESPERPALD